MGFGGEKWRENLFPNLIGDAVAVVANANFNRIFVFGREDAKRGHEAVALAPRFLIGGVAGVVGQIEHHARQLVRQTRLPLPYPRRSVSSRVMLKFRIMPAPTLIRQLHRFTHKRVQIHDFRLRSLAARVKQHIAHNAVGARAVFVDLFGVATQVAQDALDIFARFRVEISARCLEFLAQFLRQFHR